MTVALPTEPRTPRHSLAHATGPVLRVTPAPGFERGRHRRRRTELMQISVYSLVGAHGPTRKPWWHRLGAFLATWAAAVVSPAPGR